MISFLASFIDKWKEYTQNLLLPAVEQIYFLMTQTVKIIWKLVRTERENIKHCFDLQIENS